MVSHLPRGSDSFNDGEADNDPGYQQRQGHFDVEAAALRDGAGRVQGLPVPEICRGRAFVAFWLHNCTSWGKIFSLLWVTMRKQEEKRLQGHSGCCRQPKEKYIGTEDVCLGSVFHPLADLYFSDMWKVICVLSMHKRAPQKSQDLRFF